MAPPVLFDPTGRRWYRILATLVLVLVVTAGFSPWIVPRALAQTWEQPLNQEARCPRELLATGDAEDIPVLGDEDEFAFTRIGLVEESDGRAVLADPFSDEVFRTLTEEEIETVGDGPTLWSTWARCPTGS